jgi:hypothetical protein
MDVYQNSSGNFVGNEYDEFTINGTQVDSFEIGWTSSNSTSYDFAIYMYDDQGNFEDSFWIYDVYLYQTSGAGGPGDDDEYFDMFTYYLYDLDEDGYNDTIGFSYDPDTTCDCYVNITTYFDFYDNQTGNFVDSFDVEDQIYGDENDDFSDDWSPSYNGTFDVIVRLYDEDENLEDSRQVDNISLYVRSEDNDTDDESDEWFENHGHDVDLFEIDIRYDPDTDCQCILMFIKAIIRLIQFPKITISIMKMEIPFHRIGMQMKKIIMTFMLCYLMEKMVQTIMKTTFG